jgi:hypothetical protein
MMTAGKANSSSEKDIHHIRRAMVQSDEFHDAELFSALTDQVAEAVAALEPHRSLPEYLVKHEKGKAFNASRPHLKP